MADRSLGQNFVTKDDILAALVRAARIVPGRTVLEIGPGTGNLTKHLLTTGARVIAIEKDDALFARLQEQFRQVRWALAIHTASHPRLIRSQHVEKTGLMILPGSARLADWLNTFLFAVGQADNLTLVHGDVLTLNLPALLQSLTPSVPASDPARYRVLDWLPHTSTQVP